MTHVDDALTHADTNATFWGRFRCVVSSQKAMGIIQSPKIPPSCRTLHKHVGLHWMKGQIRASGAVKDTLRMGCAMRPKTMIQRLTEASLFGADKSIIYMPGIWSEMPDKILDILQKGLKDGWTQEIIEAQQEIADHEGIVDWVLWDPAYIVSDTRSLLILTDSSNDQLGLGLFTIKKADAANIKPEDVEDMSICGILNLTPKKLTTAEQNHHASEKEMTGGKEAVLRYGKIMTTATADYPEDGMSKVALAADATVSKCPTLQTSTTSTRKQCGWTVG